MQPIGLVNYLSLEKSIWWFRLLSRARRLLIQFIDDASTSSSDRLFHLFMSRWDTKEVEAVADPGLLAVIPQQVTTVINPAVACHYFPTGPRLPSQPLSITALCPAPKYTMPTLWHKNGAWETWLKFYASLPRLRVKPATRTTQFRWLPYCRVYTW